MTSFSVKSKIVLKKPDSIGKPRNLAKKSRSSGNNLNGGKFVTSCRVCDIKHADVGKILHDS